MKHFRPSDRGFAVIGSAVIVALVVFMGFGAAVIIQRNSLLHQAKLSQQRIARSAHEQLDLTVIRNPDDTVITVSNSGSVPGVFDYFLLRQPDNRMVAGPANWLESLVGWWRFSKGSGDTAYDYSGNGNDGTLYGDPEWVNGRVGDEALDFDGEDDYVEVPGVKDLSVPNTFTASAWCKSNQVSWSDTGFLLSRRNQFIIHPNSGGKTVRFYVRTQNRWESISYAPSDITIWHHYAMTYDAGELRAYVDGEQVSSDTKGDTLHSDTGSIFIGRDDGLGRFGDVLEDEVAIYDRALTPTEVSQLSTYNVLIKSVPLNPLESHTVAYPYRVDDDVTVGVVTHLGNVFWEEG